MGPLVLGPGFWDERDEVSSLASLPGLGFRDV